MTTIKKHHYVLAVPDAARTAEFFVRQLGFEVVPVDDPGWRFVSRDGLMIMLGSCPDAIKPADLGDHSYFAYFVVDDVDAFDDEIRSRGIALHDDICRMFNSHFEGAATEPDLFPADIENEHGALSMFIYEKINNGVYRAGFATSQRAYERACRDLFAALDLLEERLSSKRYLFGNRVVEADWRLFNTLIRFDPVYHGHFKCNLRRIFDYQHLDGYLRDLYQQPGIAELVNFDHIKRHYYVTHVEINPTQIVPIGPELDLERPHGREHLS